MIYFTSDLHLFHNKPFIYEPRGFETVYHMNDTVLANFQNILNWDDELYILGDCILNDNEAGIKYLKQIPGKKHIILGNHDTETRAALYEEIFLTDVIGYADVLKYNKFKAYLSHYPTMVGNFDDNDKKYITWNLSGHTHSKDKFQYWPLTIYNVALDAHDCKPVSIETIINNIKERINSNE